MTLQPPSYTEIACVKFPIAAGLASPKMRFWICVHQQKTHFKKHNCIFAKFAIPVVFHQQNPQPLEIKGRVSADNRG
jgi:hypothetical protein